MREGVAKAGLPTEIYDVIKALKSTGCVNFYACSLAAAIFGVGETNLIPEAEGIVGASRPRPDTHCSLSMDWSASKVVS